jgi:hypothetical protein
VHSKSTTPDHGINPDDQRLHFVPLLTAGYASRLDCKYLQNTKGRENGDGKEGHPMSPPVKQDFLM